MCWSFVCVCSNTCCATVLYNRRPPKLHNELRPFLPGSAVFPSTTPSLVALVGARRGRDIVLGPKEGPQIIRELGCLSSSRRRMS